MEILSTTWGAVLFTIVVFVAGALVGKPIWQWLDSKFPWNK